MNEEEAVNWDAQIDRCLMNAAAALTEATPPANLDESCQLSYNWRELAKAWSERQDAELAFQAWIEDHEDDPEFEEA